MYAQENWSGSTGAGWINNFRPDGGSNNTYDFPIDEALEPRVCRHAIGWLLPMAAADS